MDERRLSRYIYLGASCRYLEDVRAGRAVHGEGQVLENLKQFDSETRELGLHVTRGTFRYLRLPGLVEQLEQSDQGSTLTEAQQKKLGQSMEVIRATLMAESTEAAAYVVGDKRVDVKKLIKTPNLLFAPGVYAKLSELAQYDFGEGCKCIAFERPTAAAFHLMRATEEVLREMYKLEVKRRRVDPLLWGRMVEHLRERSKPPPTPLLDQLDSIREHYRNPTQHPDEIYDIHSAQDLLSVASDAIGRMGRRMMEQS